MTLTATRILIVATSNAKVGDTARKTGLWLEELATPYYAFLNAGAQIDIASTAGGEIPIDPKSQSEEDQAESVVRFLADEAAMGKFRHSLRVDDVSAEPYAAVYLPGGHGAMWDMPANNALAELLSGAFADGKVVAAVCHGPAGLVHARDASGNPLVAGRRVSAFTNSEEEAAGMSRQVPFLLESRIRELGARYESGPNLQPFAVRDGRLVTGQNPASSEQVARLVLEAIGAV